MGCASSSASNAVSSDGSGRAKRKGKKLSKDEESQEIPDEEVHKMREDILQRHDSEVDIIAQIAAEREALKTISSVKIERKHSCEDLLENMNDDNVKRLNEDPDHFLSQKSIRAGLMKVELARQSKRWMILNNLEALSNTDISQLATFLLRIIRALQKRRIAEQNEGRVPPNTHVDLSRFKRLEQAIRCLTIVTMAPASAFRINSDNLYDFDLPPGLVTVHEARLIIEVYRRGGKLLPKAVHKLLRLSYRLLKNMPNITHIEVRPEDKLTVVGDIHGQLADLFHILDAAGLPSPTNKYIFNGDFVDRGPHGVEVMCVLLALFVAQPDCVVLNRGNHEDFAICSVYGFQLECYEKYDPLTFGLFVEVFQQIPLFAIINNAVFVVHGGLFHSESATLNDLNEIERTAFTLEEMPEDGESLDAVSRDNYKAFLQQLIRDALWSDPVNMVGKYPSARGAGVSFGPDIVESFLLQNQLKFVIRSHECVRSGYEEPYTVRSSENRIGGAMLCTIFSASDYGGSGNSAAYLEFSVVPEEELPLESPTSFKTRRSTMSMSRQFSVSELAGSPVDNMSELKRVHGTNMQYTVHYFYATPLHFGAEGELGLDNGHRDTTLDLSGLVRDVHGEDGVRIDAALSHSSSRTMDGYRMPGANDILIGSSISVEELICLRKQLLLEAFERGDRVMAGHVSQQYWLRVMTDVLNVSISWRRLARFLIKEEMTSTEGESRGGPDNSNSEIKYIDFLNSFEDDIIFGRSPDDRDSIVSPPVGSAAAGASESESVGVEDVQLIAASAETSALSLVHPDKAVDEVSQRSSPVATSSSPYFGHLISSDVISALYSNHEKVEEAFRFFDTNGDNCFDLDDLLAGCATLNLLEPQDSSADNSAQGSTATPMPSSSSSLYRVDDIVQLMQIMDVFQCGAIDINIFFEMFRLSLLSTSMMDDSHWTKPLLTRELSHAHELYRLSHFVLPSTPIYPSGSAHSHAHGIHASQLSAMGSLELRKGVEIGVDSELISSRNSEVGEQVGLSIDI